VGKAATAVGRVSGAQQHDMTPLFSLAQEGRLDNFIAKMEDALEHSEIHEISTSAVMELYKYKLAAMGHSERALQVRDICLVCFCKRIFGPKREKVAGSQKKLHNEEIHDV
jgi:hypothetical protein